MDSPSPSTDSKERPRPKSGVARERHCRRADTFETCVPSRLWRRVRAGLLLALATVVLILSFAHTASAAPAESSNQVSVGLIPVSFAGYLGDFPGFSEGKLEFTTVISVGVAASYARAFGKYFELRPRIEYVHALPGLEPGSKKGSGGQLHELRGVLSASGLLPIERGKFDLTLGVEGGLARFTFQSRSAYGWTLGAILGFRAWVTETVGIYGDFGSTLSLATDCRQCAGPFEIGQFRLLKATFGVSMAL